MLKDFWLIISAVVLLLAMLVFEEHGVFAASRKELSAKEKAVLGEFRPLVQNLLVADYMKTDAYHLRWLRATKFNLEEAVDMVKRTSKWRKVHRIDGILSEHFDSADKESLPYLVDGFDKENHPILQVFFGKWEIRKYVSSGRREILMRVFYQMLEKIETKMYETEKLTGRKDGGQQAYLLADLEGFNVSKHHAACHQCIALFLQFIQMIEPHHPNFFKKAILINVPTAFSPAIALMDNFLTGPTLKAVKFYGHHKYEWSPIVLSDILPNEIPPKFGGTRKSLA